MQGCYESELWIPVKLHSFFHTRGIVSQNAEVADKVKMLRRGTRVREFLDWKDKSAKINMKMAPYCKKKLTTILQF